MDYASAAARHRPNLQAQRPAVAVNPLRHLSHLQGLSLLVDLKAIRPNNTKVERADFVIKDLGVQAEEVLSIFVDHVTQLLILTLESEAAFNTALERLHAGVPWASLGRPPTALLYMALLQAMLYLLYASPTFPLASPSLLYWDTCKSLGQF